MSDNKKQQRNKDFEEWFISQGYPENDLEHDHIGSYYATRTRYMWEAWDSASCHAAQPVVLSDAFIQDRWISILGIKMTGPQLSTFRAILAAKEQA